MKYGLIGIGNLSLAFLRGGLTKGLLAKKDVFVFDDDKEKLQSICAELGVARCDSALGVLDVCETLVLSEKPETYTNLFPDITEKLIERRQLVISFSEDTTIEKIEDGLNCIVPIIKIALNLSITCGSGVIGFCCNDLVTISLKGEVIELMSGLGNVIEVPEEMFPVFEALVASGSILAYELISTLSRSAMGFGMKRQDSLKMACDIVNGSGKLVTESWIHPSVLIDESCVPEGCAVRSLEASKKTGFESSIFEVIESSIVKKPTRDMRL